MCIRDSSYLLVAISAVLMFRVWRQTRGEQRRLALLVFIGVLLPVGGNVIYQIALLTDLPLYVDLTVLAFALSVILFTWGWLRLRLADLVPELIEPAPVSVDVDVANLAHNTQRRILNLVSLALAVLLFLALVPILTLLFRDGPDNWPFMVAYIALYALVVGVALSRNAAYGPRAAGLAAVYLGLLMLDVRINGLTPAAGLYICLLYTSRCV